MMRSFILSSFCLLLCGNTFSQASMPNRITFSDTCIDKEIKFSVVIPKDAVKGFRIVQWTFDDPRSGIANTSADTAPVHRFSKTGTYTVRTVCNYPGGTISLKQIVHIDSCKTTEPADTGCSMIMPAVLSPNGRQTTFGPPANCSFDMYEISIFNRWGILVFKSTDPMKHWTGNENKENAPEGTYFYSIKYKLAGKAPAKDLNGSVTLIR